MPVDPDRAESLFHAALAVPPADRSALLAARCGGDAELRARVERLLAAHAQLGAPPGTASFAPRGGTATFGDRGPATEDHTPRPDAGTLIAGKYKLIEEIGAGGMGSVWMAEQTEPVRRRVAVKLVKAGMDSRAVLARFEAERQALALMDHPNIAKVLDAGATADGHPFFVMELVKGVPITEYCDAHKLTPRERLELFVPVCQALQHAHQKGVIHRDIKPSNVLVALYDDRPVPKVIDFGIAKAAGQPLTEPTLATGFGAVVGTPEYMSPEQASFNNLDIDTRSDVYALGVLLYELLAGSTPFSRKDLEKVGLLEIFRVVREVEPLRPSTKLSSAAALPTLSANRGTEPAKLARLLRGELDWIVMKALEKDRNRRYDTANGFASDVQRYLAGEPVQAVPPSAGYRLRKFLRRNRGPVVAAALVFAALVAGITGTTVGLFRAIGAERRAERDRDKAVSAKNAESAALAQVTKARTEEAAALVRATAAKNEEAKARQLAERAASDTRENFNGFADTVTSGLYESYMREPTPAERVYLARLARYYTEAARTPGETPTARVVRGQAHYYLALLATLQNDEAGLAANLGPAEDLLARAADALPDDALVHRYLGLTRAIRTGKETVDRYYAKLSKDTGGKPPPQPPLRYILAPFPLECVQSIYELWRDLTRRFPEDPVIRSRAADSAGKYAQTLFGATPAPSASNPALHATLELCIQVWDEEAGHRRWTAAREPLIENWNKLRAASNNAAEAGLKLWLCKPGEVPGARRVLGFKRESYRVLFDHIAPGRDAELTLMDSTAGTYALNTSLFDATKWPDAPAERVKFWSELHASAPKSRMLAQQVAYAKWSQAEFLVSRNEFAAAPIAWREAIRLARESDLLFTKGAPTLQRDPDGRLRPVEGKINPGNGMNFLRGLIPITETCLTAKRYDTARLAAADLVNEMEALAELAKEPLIVLSAELARGYDLLGRAYAEDGRIEEFVAVERRRIAAVTANAARGPQAPWQPTMRIADAHERFGIGLLKYGRPAEAVAAFRDSLGVYRNEYDAVAKRGGAVDPYAASSGVSAAQRISFALRGHGRPEWKEFLKTAFELDVAMKVWKTRTPPWELPRYYGHVCATAGDYAEALRAYRAGMARDWPQGSNPEVNDTPEHRARMRRLHPLDQWCAVVLALDGKAADAIKEVPAPGATAELADYVRAALPALAGKPADTEPLFAALHARDLNGTDPFAARELARTAAAVGPACGLEAAELVRLAELGYRADGGAWGHHVVALARLRAGNLDEAVLAVAEARELDPRWHPALNDLVLSLVAHKRGNAEMARTYLRTATETPVGFGALPADVVEYQLLLREVRYRVSRAVAPAPRPVRP